MATEHDPADGATASPDSTAYGVDGNAEAPVPDETIRRDSPASPANGDGAEAAPCGKCAEYLDSLTRLKAEFANYRRRSADQLAQAAERGAADLVTRLLAVLDASEAGAAHDTELVGPLHNALLDTLTEGGLEVISPVGEPFDPNYHEAVLHTSGETPVENSGEPIVTDVLRTGYAWSGRVLRPAVVGVRG